MKGEKRDSALLVTLREELAKIADPARAKQMQAYMKSEMPCHGVRNGELRAITKALFAEIEFASGAAWQREVRAMWRGAEFREERYAAVELSMHRRAREHQTLEALPLYEELIVEGAWWDLVDDLAAHGVGRLVANHPKEMKRAMLAWSRSDDMWKRRTSILCQLTRKKDTDLDLLERAILASIDAREFFLRKAIGWALRQHARTDAEWVKRFVKEHDARLSGLSKREALKHLG